MLIQTSDYNGAAHLISMNYQTAWQELDGILQAMPLHLKVSGQRGRQGRLVFDPIAANEYIKTALEPMGWLPNPAIPAPFSSMGLGVDFAKLGIVGETQFAHYGLFLNNILRSEFFSKAKVAFANQPTSVLIVITKAAMFPAANSSLYYEQAVGQCTLLEKFKAFDIPTRLIGLFSEKNTKVAAVLTTYNARTGRTIDQRTLIQCLLTPGHGARCRLDVHA